MAYGAAEAHATAQPQNAVDHPESQAIHLSVVPPQALCGPTRGAAAHKELHARCLDREEPEIRVRRSRIKVQGRRLPPTWLLVLRPLEFSRDIFITGGSVGPLVPVQFEPALFQIDVMCPRGPLLRLMPQVNLLPVGCASAAHHQDCNRRGNHPARRPHALADDRWGPEGGAGASFCGILSWRQQSQPCPFHRTSETLNASAVSRAKLAGRVSLAPIVTKCVTDSGR